ncbi:MAG: aldolase catalytic domain-containing protein [Candidatus Hydrogenedentes bacterium]|nr:aldolase catalytic domain-containing protein [Candidatus Hydrogenedentota bacterium]
MYRPEIKVLDCTIRDGGLMNNWEFDKPMVKDVFQGLVDAGVDYVELGYRADKKQFDPKNHGPWRFCDEEDLRDVAFECDTKISVMVDVGRTDYDAFLPKDESIISMFRVATYAKEVDKAIHLGRHIQDLGYEVCVNIMAASTVIEPDLDEALAELAKTSFEAVYLVDSFGYFFSEQIHYLADKYLDGLNGKTVGIHCHNNQQLAFANTIEGIRKGINMLDGSIYGMGRAAGNCTTELLLGFLKNPKYDVRPVLALIEKYFESLKAELKWGYEMPYMIAGNLNRHPKTSLAYMQEGNPLREKGIVAFYNQQVAMEDID